MIKRIFQKTCIVFAVCLTSSCSPRIISREVVRDSIIFRETISYRDTTVNYYVTDSVVINITRDTSSRIETDFAISDASITNGQLAHRLRNKAGLRAVTIKLPEVTREVTGVRDKVMYIDVPAQLTRWERIFILSGKIALALMGLLILYQIFRICKR